MNVYLLICTHTALKTLNNCRIYKTVSWLAYISRTGCWYADPMVHTVCENQKNNGWLFILVSPWATYECQEHFAQIQGPEEGSRRNWELTQGNTLEILFFILSNSYRDNWDINHGFLFSYMLMSGTFCRIQGPKEEAGEIGNLTRGICLRYYFS